MHVCMYEEEKKQKAVRFFGCVQKLRLMISMHGGHHKESSLKNDFLSLLAHNTIHTAYNYYMIL
jgi:hypothetical protein